MPPEARRPPDPQPAVSDSLPDMRLIHHLARTGGTTIAKCIAVMPRVALLSEVHPMGTERINPLHQAHDWHGLIDQQEIDRLGPSPDFARSLQLIALRASSRGRHLVIRDWAHLDFHAGPLSRQPGFQLTTAERLAPHFRLLQTATVRHPIDHWQSLRRVPAMRGQIDLGRFLQGYRRFAEIAAALGFVRFEDFCADPDAALQRLCASLDLAYDPTWRARWAQYDLMTGDETAKQHSGELKQPKRRLLEPGLADAFLKHPDYGSALDLLGYGHPV